MRLSEDCGIKNGSTKLYKKAAINYQVNTRDKEHANVYPVMYPVKEDVCIYMYVCDINKIIL